MPFSLNITVRNGNIMFDSGGSETGLRSQTLHIFHGNESSFNTSTLRVAMDQTRREALVLARMARTDIRMARVNARMARDSARMARTAARFARINSRPTPSITNTPTRVSHTSSPRASRPSSILASNSEDQVEQASPVSLTISRASEGAIEIISSGQLDADDNLPSSRTSFQFSLFPIEDRSTAVIDLTNTSNNIRRHLLRQAQNESRRNSRRLQGALGRYTVQYKYKKHTKNGDDQSEKVSEDDSVDDCSICYNIFITDQDVRRLPCFHLFHTHCIDKWLLRNRRCPMCRAHIEEQFEGNT